MSQKTKVDDKPNNLEIEDLLTRRGPLANVMHVKKVVEEEKIAVKKMETTPTEDIPKMEKAEKKTDEEFGI